MSWLKGGWMLTYTGRQFYPLSPRAEDIDIADVAHALSLQCRYNGHVSRFYSVAEHCVLISRAVPEEHALWGLLHDAAEAYVGDMVRPLKRDMPEFSAVEDHILAIMAVKWGLPTLEIPTAVHQADARILLNERAELLNLNGHRWDDYVESLAPLEDTLIAGWGPEQAEVEYLERFSWLLGRR